MPAISDLLDVLERIAPARYAFSWDKVGLQVGDPSAKLSTGVVSLDRSLAAARFAVANKAEVLLSHHPLIFTPLSTVDTRSVVGRTVLELARSNVAFIAAHTNWDCAEGGINDALAERLDLHEYLPFGEAAEARKLKLCVFVPTANAEQITDAASAAGAGEIGNYRRCAYSAEGKGTFEPMPGANPAIGHVGGRETVEEIRVEMILPESRRGAVEAAIRAAHPYEEPAIDFFALAPEPQLAIGRIGSIAACSLEQFSAFVDSRLATKCWTWGGAGRRIERVAVVGGGADDEWAAAQESGADVLVTGEVKQHVALECVESGFAVIAAGHYATEQPGCAALRDRLAKEMSAVEWLLFEPAAGEAGRPH